MFFGIVAASLKKIETKMFNRDMSLTALIFVSTFGFSSSSIAHTDSDAHNKGEANEIRVPVSVVGNSHLLTESPGDLDELSELFSEANVVSGPELVSCTLSGGAKTTCFSITVKQTPSSYTPGPWCPSHINDSADAGGIWLEEGEVHDVDGNFIKNLASFYDDEKFSLYDEVTGKIRVTDTYEKCEGAARPDVEEQYQQHCVECLPEYLSENATVTYTIPVSPQNLGSNTYETRTSGSGLAFNGVRLDGSAPVADILGNYTLAPFDDCGGHINLNVGYHYHAATDCLNETAKKTSHGNIVGVAMDGHALYARLSNTGELPEDLDSCGGHDVEGIGYHYHAGEEGSNKILSCLVAEVGCVSEDPNASCDASASQKEGGSGKPDFSKAAEELGVSEQELRDALGGRPPNLQAAAQKLGVPVAAIVKALGLVGKR